MPTYSADMLPTLPARRLLVAALVAACTTAVVGAAPATAAPCTDLLGIPICLQPASVDDKPPTVAGDRKIGKVLTASGPTWDQAGVTTTYQWRRDGEDITGADQASYALTGDDYDTIVTVVATGTNSNGLSGMAESEPIEPDLGGPITASRAPVVSGTAEPGKTLTTTTGTWPGTPEPTYTYQWYRSRPTGSGSQVIPGATEASYTPVVADAGRTVVVLVTADRFGYAKGVAVSNTRTLPRATSTTTLTLATRTVKKGRNATVRIVVTGPTGVDVTGKATVFDGKRRIRTVALTVADGGVKTFTIPRQRVGQHRLTARYLGDNALTASTSGVQVLTVTR